ncbi:uncharacterized protein LOC134236422 isoform X2 [Saccostrea cucullata]|uniref:uncharacterized protein LOC134236422 isoform X2 n=1 Tax=Saccostrea cuccullata TaxID=36930 RepID=UPI002ED471A5
MRPLLLLTALIVSIKARDFSLLTGSEKHNSTDIKDDGQATKCNEMEFIKYMLNQGTGVGLAVAKNVHTLVGDVDSIKQSIESAESAMNNFQQTIETLQTKINTLQLENQRLESIVVNCQGTIKKYDEKLKTADKMIQAFSERLNVTETKTNEDRQALLNRTIIFEDVQIDVKNLSMKQEDLSNSVSKLEGWARKIEYNQLNMTSTLALLESITMETSKEQNDNRHDNGKSIVAFTAGYDQFSQQDTTRTDMVFPKVITNVGGGYNPRDGIFTAPFNGSYVFYTTIVSWDNGKIATDIVLNGKSQVRTFADSRGFQNKNQEYIYQTGTNLAA